MNPSFILFDLDEPDPRGKNIYFQRHQEISDLFEDFRDGIKLLALLEVLTSQILVSLFLSSS